MNASCDDVRTLLTSYLDGELSETQAKPVRTHLLSCGACRDAVQEGKVIRRWFRAGAGRRVEPPPGFAARVARRAFAGDPGLLVPAAPREAQASRPLLPFLLRMTAAAAVLLFALSLLLRSQTLPAGESLQAGDRFWEQEPEPDPVQAQGETSGEAFPEESEAEPEERDGADE